MAVGARKRVGLIDRLSARWHERVRRDAIGAAVGVEGEHWNVDSSTLRVANDTKVVQPINVLDDPDLVVGEKMAPEGGGTNETNQSQSEWAFNGPSPLYLIRENILSMRLARASFQVVRGLFELSTATPISEPEGGHQFSNKPRVLEWIADVSARNMRQHGLITGQHVHVDIQDLDLAMEVANRIRPWLPIIDAVVANSSIFHGRFMGVADQRLIMGPGLRGYRNDGPYPDSFAEYQLEGLEFLKSVGIDRDDPTRLLDEVRPHVKYKTVEARGADVPLTVDASHLHAMLIAAAVNRALDDIFAGKPRDSSPDPKTYYRKARAHSATYGLKGTLVDPHTQEVVPAEQAINTMMKWVGPGLRRFDLNSSLVAFDLKRSAETLLDEVRTHGTGAEQQLVMWAAINRRRRNERLPAVDPQQFLRGEAEMHPDEMKDLTLALITRSMFGSIDDAFVFADYRNPLVAGLTIQSRLDPEGATRWKELSDLTMLAGRRELDRLGFSWDQLDLRLPDLAPTGPPTEAEKALPADVPVSAALTAEL